MTWQSAIQKAEGVKVKDNPELLKKVRKGKRVRVTENVRKGHLQFDLFV